MTQAESTKLMIDTGKALTDVANLIRTAAIAKDDATMQLLLTALQAIKTQLTKV